MTDRERALVEAARECETCHGQGEIYTHTEDCRSDWCALAGGMDDCLGQVIECPSCQYEEPKG